MLAEPQMEQAPGAAAATGPGEGAAPRVPEDVPAPAVWYKRLEQSRQTRDEYAAKIWKPLYDGYLGSLMRKEGDADVVNAFAQFVEVAEPHLVGDNRTCTVRVTRIGRQEDPEAKQALAELLGPQATGLARAVGLYEDATGQPGEMVQCIFDAMYAVGVLVFGFEQREGLRQTPTPAGPRTVDLDWSAAQRAERADAGMPWARCCSPLHCLFDFSFNHPGRGQWFAVETFQTIAELEARWPQHRGRWKQTHSQTPGWSDDGGPRDANPDGEQERSGLVRLYYVYTRTPIRLLILPDEKSGVTEFVEARDLQLGIEGLPLLLLGSRWPRHEPYPKPALADQYGPARAENEHMQTVFAAGAKIKTGVVTDDEELAQQLRAGSDNGVYTVKPGRPPDTAWSNLQAGGVREENLTLADKARANWERNAGMADMQLGVREPGNRTVPEIQARQAHISSRMAGLVKPVRRVEAAAHRNLLAIAYANIEALHGLQLPTERGLTRGLVAFDAGQPMIGEWFDFAFEVQTSDELTDADELATLNQLLQTLPGYQQLLAAEGTGLRLTPLVEEMLRKSGLARTDEIIAPLPPQAQGPGVERQGPEGSGAEGAGAEAGAPPEAAAGEEADPQAQLEQLYAALEQVPEGDPREDAILQQIAALSPQPAAA